MGATAWFDWAPYRPDPEAALQARRAELFAQGDFIDPAAQPGKHLAFKFGSWGLPADETFVQKAIDMAGRLEQAMSTDTVSELPQDERRAVEMLRRFGITAAAFKGEPEEPPHDRKPASIEGLLEIVGTTGTHSLLDIEHVSARPRGGHASPLSATARRKIFGTLEPSFEMVEILWQDVANTLRPGFARWCRTHETGRLDRIAFIGVTGD